MNKRNTVQRALVLEAVRALRCHAAADEVYQYIAGRHPDIGRATVYRNLNLLCELGEIRRREVPGGADRYDHLTGDHYHVQCVRCGRVYDVDMDFMADLEKRVKDAHGFEFTGHDILFKGICPECNHSQQQG